MSMVKGRYVARLILELNVDENEKGLKSFERLRDDFKNGLTDELRNIIADEMHPAVITLEQQYADVWREENAVD